jgi:hypothetical protein
MFIEKYIKILFEIKITKQLPRRALPGTNDNTYVVKTY